MPPKKVAWGDIPNEVFIEDKDNDKGKWIKCKICHVVIRVRASFGFTEWENHCSSLRHCQKVKDQLLIGNSSKLTSYFISDNSNKKKENPTDVKLSSNKRIKLVTPCPGFSFGKNPELLQLYHKYRKNDTLNKSIFIHCRDGVWSTHSCECTNEAVRNRNSKRVDKNACKKCFEFPSIQLVKDRIKRMEKILHVEQYLTKPRASKTGYLEVSNFMRTNVTQASPATLLLRERCLKYISHHDWLEENFNKLQTYDAIDDAGKVHHQSWLKKVGKMYSDEPSMKSSLLHALMQFTLSRYKGDVTAPASPKLIGFFQTLYALNPSIYRLFSKHFGGYNERTLQRMSSNQSAEVPVVNCEIDVIRMRTKTWINQIRTNDPSKLLLISAMADATKVPPVGEFSYRYNSWVGGSYPNHCIDADHYDQEKMVTNEMATEIKVGLLSLQEYTDGICPFKIISARPQSTNESCDEYNYNIRMQYQVWRMFIVFQ